jgi:DNA polymerase III alpha subunit (gram-positive type)
MIIKIIYGNEPNMIDNHIPIGYQTVPIDLLEVINIGFNMETKVNYLFITN